MRIFQRPGEPQAICIVPPIIVFPVTLSVLCREVAHQTVSVFEKFEAPVTPRVPPIIAFPVLRNVPLISREYPGVIVFNQINDHV